MPELEALAAKHDLGLLEDACEALGAVDSEGRKVGARGNLATFAFYANKQLTTGEGGMIVPARRRRSPPACAASATRAAPPTWAGSTTAASASTTASPTSPPRSASPSSRSSTRCWPPAPASRALRASACAGRRGGARRRSPAAAPSGAAGSSTRCGSPTSVDRDATIARLAERGVASKAYLPCIHLFPHLRELGYREGQFPVAEAASARSLALPFFPAMSEAQVSAGVRGSRRNPSR